MIEWFQWLNDVVVPNASLLVNYLGLYVVFGRFSGHVSKPNYTNNSNIISNECPKIF